MACGFRLAVWVVVLGLASPALAVEYRSVAVNAAILYDAPSTQARKLYLLSRDYPVEIVVTLDKWVKVRDATGSLAWVESSRLSPRRTVLVTAPQVEVRQAPQPSAPVVFQAEKDVVLELTEFTGNGWVRVRHRDGQSGYVPMNQVWGL
ncbi:SH3 domain-containing protein [Thiobacter aerophilum]|uniref:SH3 domain-containing protein n=1 Tax=Thiobacter aerophilum TaxID=3121275 RepID=A0ABV0EDZ3_9BURK